MEIHAIVTQSVILLQHRHYSTTIVMFSVIILAASNGVEM